MCASEVDGMVIAIAPAHPKVSPRVFPKYIPLSLAKEALCRIGNTCWRGSMQIGNQYEIWSLTSHFKLKGVLVFPAMLGLEELTSRL